MSDEKFPPLKRHPLLSATLPPENPPVRTIKAARIRFAPAQPTGLHRHPMSTCGVVTEGSFILQFQGDPEPRILRTGDCFFEPAHRTVLHFDNASETAPAEIICFYLSDETALPPIEMLPGGLDQQLGQK